MTLYKNGHSYQRLTSEDDAQPPDYFGRTGWKRTGGNSEWSRIDDLDQFFIQVYTYYDQKGLLCIAARELFELAQFAFIVFVALIIGVATNYHFILYYGTREITDHEDLNGSTHQTVTYQYDGMSIFEAIDFSRFSRLSEDQVFGLGVFLFVASLFWSAHFIYSIRKIWHAFHIRRFYADHLRITDAELPSKLWSDVVGALVRCQDELSLCVEKERLTELDIVHRILRRVNYLIAMQNKGVIDHLYYFPLIGQRTFLTEGMRFNLKLILFSDPFATRWQLRDEYKRSLNRVGLAERMSKRFFYIGLLNLFLSPFVLVWQILFSFFSYAEVIRRQPGTLGTRKWSHYSRIKLRHFNELDHELRKRLTFAYKPAKSYMEGFSSRIVAIIGECVAFFAGAWLAILTVVTVLNENLIMSDHILAAYTILILIFTTFRMLIPNEEIAFDSKKSMEKVDRYVHYIPPLWRTEPHTDKVRLMFSRLFQYKVTAYVEELVSPIVTPLLLMFCLRHRSLEIVDFYQRFTVDVEGVGDVCSFALMDVKKHGNPMFLSDELTEANDVEQAEDGKTEKSLLNFKGKYPAWRPSPVGELFLMSVSQQGLPPVAAQAKQSSSPDPLMTLGALPAVPEVISLSQLGPSSPEQQQKRDHQTSETATTQAKTPERETSFTTQRSQDTTPVVDSLATSSLYPGLVSYPMNSLYPVSALDAVRDEYGQSVSAVDNSINEQMLFVQRHAECQEQRVRSSHQRFLGQSLSFRQDTNYTSDESSV